MKSESQQKPIIPCSLREYVKFLRDNNFLKEASYYEKEVVNTLEKAGFRDPLSLMTKEVVAALYAIVDAADAASAAEETQIANSRPWEVELVS